MTERKRKMGTYHTTKDLILESHNSARSDICLLLIGSLILFNLTSVNPEYAQQRLSIMQVLELRETLSLKSPIAKHERSKSPYFRVVLALEIGDLGGLERDWKIACYDWLGWYLSTE